MNFLRSLSMVTTSVCLTALLPLVSFTAEQDEARETARLLAILLDAGRVTVANNQDLINDPAKADKGFTAEVFAKQTTEEFNRRTGLSLEQIDGQNVPEIAKPLLARLLEESKKTIDSHQPVINVPGIRYKGLIPATFGTETAGRFKNWSGVYLKQTAPQALVRNPKNLPDEYESNALSRIAAQALNMKTDSFLSEIVDQDQAVRVLLPLYYTKSCLTCHGQPKGERDMSGYPREGAKEGDLGGAISVKIPLH